MKFTENFCSKRTRGVQNGVCSFQLKQIMKDVNAEKIKEHAPLKYKLWLFKYFQNLISKSFKQIRQMKIIRLFENKRKISTLKSAILFSRSRHLLKQKSGVSKELKFK